MRSSACSPAKRSDERKAREQSKAAVAETATRFLGEARTYLHKFEANYKPGLSENFTQPDFQPVYESCWTLVFLAPRNVGDAARQLKDAVQAYDLLWEDPRTAASPLSVQELRTYKARHVAGRRMLVETVQAVMSTD